MLRLMCHDYVYHLVVQFIVCHSGRDPEARDSSVPRLIRRGETATSLDTGFRRDDGSSLNPEGLPFEIVVH